MHSRHLVLMGLAGVSLMLLSCGSESSEALNVAVASNFVAPAEALAKEFEATHEIKVSIIPGSTGKLYAQIENGAPFDIFLAADVRRPELLASSGLGIADSRFTYAIGELVLYSPDAGYIGANGKVLESGSFEHLAIANPELAPYGMAAEQVLKGMGLWDQLQPKLVRGENISQTLQFVSNGNAQLGFIAHSQLPDGGSSWLIPSDLHDPIEQQAIIISATERMDDARAFVQYLQNESAKQLIESFGYRTPDL